MTDASAAATTTSGRWRYRAAAADGASVRGEIDAATEREAIDALRRRALWVVDLSPVAGARGAERITSASTGATESPWARLADRAGASDADLAVVVRAVATLLGAGVPLHRALAYACQEAATTRQRAGFAAVRDAVERGESLSAAITAQPMFPPVFAPLIAAGEESGTLDASLSLLADYLERRDTLRTRLRSALVYPTILGVASIIGVIVILLVVVPRFATLISDAGGTLPLSTRALMAVSSVLTQGWWAVLAVVAVTALAFERWLRDPAARRRLDAARLSWPIIGRMERTQAAAGYTGTLAIGLRAGVSLLGSMALARAVVRNHHLATSLAEAEVRVRAGSTLASALSGLLPPLSERLLDAGEASGDLAGMASRAAEASDAELQRGLSQAIALIEPAMIVGFGGIVGFVALALLQAIYGLNAGIL